MSVLILRERVFRLHDVIATSYLDGSKGVFVNSDRHPAVIHGNGGPQEGKEYYWRVCEVLLKTGEEGGCWKYRDLRLILPVRRNKG